jgi:pyruvate dehydrogenase E2 component (dihydrolipoamide acetyltransferase)
MAIAVILPKLDEAMRTGTIMEWKKKEGERVEKGEVILIIETEKVNFEIVAEDSGILSKITAEAGDEVPVGAIIAFILQPGEKAPEVPEPIIKAGREVRAEAPKLTKKAEPTKQANTVIASPLAKKIAEEHNIDISTVKGTGPGGRIVREDVMRVVEESRTAVVAAKPLAEEQLAVEEEVVPVSSMRKAIARRMVESFQSAPHFYLTVEVDTKELGEIRQQLIPIVEERVGVKLTLTDLLVKVVAKALEDCPDVNCSYIDGSVKQFNRINIGLVIAVEGGLVVPVIRQANELSLPQIVKIRAELTEKANERKLSLDEMKGSTFTISNLGMFGVDQFSAIIEPPEAAILAIGRIIDKPVVMEAEIVIRPRMNLTMSIDHRVLDGVSGARFLQKVKELIEKPTLLLLQKRFFGKS